MLRYDEAPVWSASRPIFRAGQNTRPTGDGGDPAEPAQSRKQDHPQPANTGNRINQTTRTALHAKRPADQTEWPNRNFNRKSNRHAEVFHMEFGTCAALIPTAEIIALDKPGSSFRLKRWFPVAQGDCSMHRTLHRRLRRRFRRSCWRAGWQAGTAICFRPGSVPTILMAAG